MKRWKKMLGWVLAGLVLAACGTVAAPARTFVKGEEVAYYDFSEANTFEEGTYNEGAARLQIRDGVYRIVVTEGDSEVWYGQWGESFNNVVIDVEAKQLTESENTVYGVMCRMRGRVGQRVEAVDVLAEATPEATAESTPELRRAGDPTPAAATETPTSDALTVNNGDGYLFLLEGTGRFAIMRARGRSVVPLRDWASADVIRKGPAQNTIRAVCLNDYLALYVNGTFLGDVIDDTYTGGQVGLVAAAAGRLGVTVEFDNLTVSEARAG